MAGKKVEFLFLSQEEMLQAGVLDMRRCVEVMDEVFKLLWKGDCLMGGPTGDTHGFRLWFPPQAKGPHMPVDAPGRRFMSMIAYLGGEFNVCGQKWYGANTENPVKRHLPRSVLLVTLNDPVTAEPLAIMDGNLISAMRTGAVTGLGAKYLARKDAEVAGIVGAGVISRTAVMALAVGVPNLKEAKVFDIVRGKAESFSEEMSKKLGIHVHPVDTLEEAVRNADAISVAIAGKNTATFKSEWFKEGAFIALSSSMAEIPNELWRSSKIVADNWKMHIDAREEGDRLPEGILRHQRLIHPSVHELIRRGKLKDDDIVDLARIAFGGETWKADDAQKVLFITFGMALEDVAWGCTVYKQALKQGLGQTLRLWNEPYWF